MAILFDLRKPLVYQSAGISGLEALDLELIAPSYEQRAYSRKLKQMIQLAVEKTSREDDLHRVKLMAAAHIDLAKTDEFKSATAEEPEAEPQTALERQKEEIANICWMRKTMLTGLQPGGFSEAVEEFAKNARYLVRVDKEVMLEEALIKQIDETEFEELFASYCLNFTLPCLL